MSVERLYYALLGIPPLNGLFSNRQVIFPSIRFRCTGEVVKWILAGRWITVRFFQSFKSGDPQGTVPMKSRAVVFYIC
jgi:hypothetical protein